MKPARSSGVEALNVYHSEDATVLRDLAAGDDFHSEVCFLRAAACPADFCGRAELHAALECRNSLVRCCVDFCELLVALESEEFK